MSSIAQPPGRDDERGDDKAMPVGLAENPSGVPFQCGTCEWFSQGASRCENRNPKLNGLHVEPQWCCNLFDRDDMKVLVHG